jgi:hypothetical protein
MSRRFGADRELSSGVAGLAGRDVGEAGDVGVPGGDVGEEDGVDGTLSDAMAAASGCGGGVVATGMGGSEGCPSESTAIMPKPTIAMSTAATMAAPRPT